LTVYDAPPLAVLSHASPPLALTVLQLALLAALAAAYGQRARRLARGGRRIAPARQLCFAAGIVLSAVAIAQPGEDLLFVRAIWLLVLGSLAPLLIVLGLTLPLLAPLMRLAPAQRLRVLAHPLIAFPLWALNLCLWQLPSLYQAAARHAGIGALQHLLLLGAGVNLWVCLLGPLPVPNWFGNRARMLYAGAVWLTGAALGNLLLWSDAVFYSDYVPIDALRRVSPLADQNLAGAAMLVEVSLLTIALFWWLFARAARESAERGELLALAARSGIALSERRASRAIAAGRGEELRARIEHHALSIEAKSAASG
jgi:putative membrane protein